jgi:NitT/TauT family transport system substrate-binding protein
MTLSRILLVLCLGLSAFLGTTAHADSRKSFNICWTIYAGWMPWEYAQAQGIVQKWAKKYDIQIKLTQLNDYIESINQYTAGQFDGCTMTNMDALTIPAVGGVDSTALIPGSYSNGNDGIVLKGRNKTLKDIKGLDVYLVQFSVAHYLLARALETIGLSERDVKVVNTSDADIVGAFATQSVQAAVAWNPQLSAIVARPGVSKVFDSSKVPGEILDLLVVNSATLKENPNLGKALVGAWFEVMALMKARNVAALSEMAKAAGTTLEGYQAQLATTALLHEPAQALQLAEGPKLPDAMQRVARFSFDKGLLGEGAPSAEVIGISFPDGRIYGSTRNIKLRFDATFLRLAATGKL